MGTEQRIRPASNPQVKTMDAVVQDVYGEAGDVLRFDQIPVPSPAGGEVLVRVHAAGVDRGAWHLMAGLPYPVRLAGYGIRRPKTGVRGREFAGRIEALGEGVTGFAVGDAVYGIGEGCFAEYARASAAKIAPKPKNLTFEQAAAVPISGMTALQGLRDSGQVKRAQQVLIIGASGGVGTFAVQIAKALGAEVTGVCGTAKTDLVRSIGADHVIDYTRDDITGRRYDFVLDIGGHRSLTHLRRALGRRGTLVIVGSETGGRWLGGFDRSLRAPLLSMFVEQNLRALMNSENSADLHALTELVETGAVVPVIDRTYPLHETAAAIQRMQDGRVKGKLVISVRSENTA
ncbi:NAD(P)-dependent alcohol dehydrogenase [Amycolatopsis sp. NPDC059657]|uniref:NAD(P)-dependent alcohol dehydrogenase n=1 Tax=Amycolatopsis sp. NPDC059657 TaxID=3346899 RepID=UPI003672495A